MTDAEFCDELLAFTPSLGRAIGGRAGDRAGRP